MTKPDMLDLINTYNMHAQLVAETWSIIQHHLKLELAHPTEVPLCKDPYLVDVMEAQAYFDKYYSKPEWARMDTH